MNKRSVAKAILEAVDKKRDGDAEEKKDAEKAAPPGPPAQGAVDKVVPDEPEVDTGRGFAPDANMTIKDDEERLKTIHGTYGGLTLSADVGDYAGASPQLTLNLAGEGRSARAVFWREQYEELMDFLESIRPLMAQPTRNRATEDEDEDDEPEDDEPEDDEPGEEPGGAPTDEGTKKELFQYIVTNGNPSDAQVHALAKQMGVEPDDLEETIYSIIGSFKAGKSVETGLRTENVDPGELKMGIEVEREHSDLPFVQERIAMDHLAEIPDYYTRLKKMEDDAKAAGSKADTNPQPDDGGKFPRAPTSWPGPKKEAAGEEPVGGTMLDVVEDLLGKHGWEFHPDVGGVDTYVWDHPVIVGSEVGETKFPRATVMADPDPASGDVVAVEIDDGDQVEERDGDDPGLLAWIDNKVAAINAKYLGEQG